MINVLQFYKCLADDTRLRCLMLMQQEGELCVCELVAALELPQPKISRHLAQLRQHKLLLDRRQGQWVFYRIDPNMPEWARSVLAITHTANQPFIKPCVIKLKQMGERPQRIEVCCEQMHKK